MAESAEAAFGVQLRRSRQAAALSLRQLAARVGYDHSYLSQVERGQRPGSVHLAQLCDRALGTGPALTTAYEQPAEAVARAEVQRPGQRRRAEQPEHELAEAVPSALAVAPGGGDLLESVRLGLADSYGPGREGDEWRAVTATYGREFATTTLADLLPDLTADLQLLRSSTMPGSTALTVPAAELGVLIALTLTGLGRIRSAGRWWRTARAAADSSGERAVGSLVRGWEACSGLVERRSLPELQVLTAEALTLTADPEQTARALAARAQVFAALGDAAEAQRAIRDLLALTGELPAQAPSVFACSQQEVYGREGGVWATLGEPAAAYEALDRALSTCPPERLRERAELELLVARCLVIEGEVAAGLAVAMRVLVELPDQWHTHPLYDAAGRVLSAVRGEESGRAAVRDYRELLRRRPFDNRTVGSGSSSGWLQG
ncbi:hypothetical protein GCM10009789_64030 [Kribbella sancticallisti]|uniref:HTH cro/C1-type domain-containing protein n=1 Tax=Kribbella sancticallisti TaxID=460087 RepID=A0ABN2EEY5_9ACTN